MKVIVLFFSFFLTLFADTKLSDSELQMLKTQGYFLKQDRVNKSGMIVFDSSREIGELMDDVINFKEYPNKIDDIEKVNIYYSDSKVLKVRVFIGTFFLDFNNYVVHEIDRKNHIMRWHLDETKENYFKEMKGSWRFEKVGDKTRVYYSNHIEFKQWAPKFLEDYLLEKGVFQATDWLREE